VGCATVERAPAAPIVTTLALQPQVWESRGAPVLRRTDRGVHIDDAFPNAQRHTSKEVYSIQPVCLGSTAATFRRVHERSQRLPTRAMTVVGRRVTEFAAAAAGAQGTMDRANDMIQFVLALFVDANVVAKGSEDPVYAKASEQLIRTLKQASHIIERTTLGVFPDAVNPQPLSNEIAHEFACVGPVVRLMSVLHKRLGCLVRYGDNVERCGNAAEQLSGLETLLRSTGGTFSDLRESIIDLAPVQTAFNVAKAAMLAQQPGAVALLRGATQQLSDALRDSQRLVYQSIRRLRLVCDQSVDFLPWTRLTFAARELEVVQVVLKASTLFHEPLRVPDRVSGSLPAAPEKWFNMLEFASSLTHAYVPIGVDSNDTNILDATRAVTSTYRTTGAQLHWQVPCCSCCGFSVEWSWIAQGVAPYIPTVTMSGQSCHCPGGSPEHQDLMWGLFVGAGDTMHCEASIAAAASVETKELPLRVEVHHWDPVNAPHLPRPQCDPDRRADYTISRSMYEFGAIPSEWVPLLNSAQRYDEIWVPAEAVKAAFVGSGVRAGKILVIPEPIDTQRYSPDGRALQLPHALSGLRHATSNTDTNADKLNNNFKFLSIFKFEPRKGWDAMMKAYLSTYTAQDPVSLYIVTVWWGPDQPEGLLDDRDPYAIRHRIDDIAAALGKADRHAMPHYVIITHTFSDDDLIALYRGCDAFVLPSRGEGWGLPIIQAMSIGVPTITTAHSGMLQFTTAETVVYVDVAVQPVPAAERKKYGVPANATWGEPDVAQLTAAMQRVRRMSLFERTALGSRARRHIVEHFSVDVIGRQIADRVVEIEKDVRRRRTASSVTERM
jgi:glycosyltransferase involved in cell wall biosynthesis